MKDNQGIRVLVILSLIIRTSMGMAFLSCLPVVSDGVWLLKCSENTPLCPSSLVLVFLAWCAELPLLSWCCFKVNRIPAEGSSEISASLSCVCVCVENTEIQNAM